MRRREGGNDSIKLLHYYKRKEKSEEREKESNDNMKTLVYKIIVDVRGERIQVESVQEDCINIRKRVNDGLTSWVKNERGELLTKVITSHSFV